MNLRLSKKAIYLFEINLFSIQLPKFKEIDRKILSLQNQIIIWHYENYIRTLVTKV